MLWCSYNTHSIVGILPGYQPISRLRASSIIAHILLAERHFDVHLATPTGRGELGTLVKLCKCHSRWRCHLLVLRCHFGVHIIT